MKQMRRREKSAGDEIEYRVKLLSPSLIANMQSITKIYSLLQNKIDNDTAAKKCTWQKEKRMVITRYLQTIAAAAAAAVIK